MTVNLGVATDLSFTVSAIAVQETVTVTAQSDTVFSSTRTGAATSVNRERDRHAPDAPDASTTSPADAAGERHVVRRRRTTG